MPYNDLTNRAALEGGIPKPLLNKLWEGVTHRSLTMQAFETIPMPAGTSRMGVIDSLPFAYFQNAPDTGNGQATKFGWANKEIVAESIMCFIPIPRTVLEDTQFDVFEYILPRMEEAIAHKLDEAVLFGIGAPASYPTSLYSQAVTDSAVYTINTTAANGGIAEDLNKATERLALSGYDASHILTGGAMKNKIRRGRATDGQRYLDLSTESYEGIPFVFGSNRLFPAGSGACAALVIDRTQYVLGIRRDLELTIIDQGAIWGPNGENLYNTTSQDGVILRVIMRAGWQRANAATTDQVGVNEVQTLTQSGVSSGTQTISFGGYSTAALDREATAAEVQAALENLPSIGATNVSVARSGSAGSRVYTVTFLNALGSQNVGNLSATSTAGSIAQATTTAGVAAARVSAAALVNA